MRIEESKATRVEKEAVTNYNERILLLSELE
jgi:hypothetical protein